MTLQVVWRWLCVPVPVYKCRGDRCYIYSRVPCRNSSVAEHGIILLCVYKYILLPIVVIITRRPYLFYHYQPTHQSTPEPWFILQLYHWRFIKKRKRKKKKFYSNIIVIVAVNCVFASIARVVFFTFRIVKFSSRNAYSWPYPSRHNAIRSCA